jgi:iron complex transport system substrate-binding protein
MRAAERIVSLACSNTEIVVALGCGDRLIAVDDHSDHPPELVAALPKVGPDLQIDVQRVAELGPDLVLATLTVPGHETVVARLEAAGLPFIAPEPVSLDDVYRDIRTIGARLGVSDRAEALVADMRRTIESGRETQEVGVRPTIAVQWWPKPTITPGRLSWITDVVHWAGGRTLLSDEEVKSRPVSDEEMAERAPDAIVVSWCGVDPTKYRTEVVLDNPRLADTPAVRHGHVFTIPEAFMGRPGPRLVDGYLALRRIVETLRARAKRPD